MRPINLLIAVVYLLLVLCKCWGGEKYEIHQDLKDLLSEEEDVSIMGDSGRDDNEEGKEDALVCTSVRDLTPGVQNTAIYECCKVPTEDGNVEVKCLPSFIIAGTQKSGTTVLSAYLANHKDISFARKRSCITLATTSTTARAWLMVI